LVSRGSQSWDSPLEFPSCTRPSQESHLLDPEDHSRYSPSCSRYRTISLRHVCAADMATRRSMRYHVQLTLRSPAVQCGNSTRRRWEQISRCRFTCRIKPCMKLWPLIPGPTFPSLVHERLGRGELAAVAVAGCTRARVAANTGYFLSMTVGTIRAGPLPLLRCAGSCLCNRRGEIHARKKRDEGGARM